MNLEKLNEILSDLPKFRSKQCYSSIFVDLIDDWEQATTLPTTLREQLKKEIPLKFDAEEYVSKDNKTVKVGLTFDGDLIEAVLMRHASGRNTVCVSSQVGCAIGCSFCATGKLGFKRNLTAAEIVSQVLYFSRYLKAEDSRVSNVVFMGMGEPFLNYDEVFKAIRILNDKELLNIGIRKISISTAGVVDGINRLGVEGLDVNLAVSIHASNDKVRSRIIPVNKKWPLKDLLKSIGLYQKKTNRRVMIEYLLLQDKNDSTENATELAQILRENLGTLFFVNLLTYNETENFKPSTASKRRAFKNILEQSGIEVVERYRFGHDVKAACGQLAAKGGKGK